MKPDNCGISVVTPTFNRAEFLPDLFGSLRKAAENFKGNVEIIVVDDSSPKEAEITRQLCEENGAIYLAGVPSVREKRNLGIQTATNEIILFVDSDCIATDDLFNQHINSYKNADSDVAGIVGITEFVGEDSWFWEVVSRSQFLNAFSFARRMEFAPWATCTNTSYKRRVLLDLGGFEVNFPFKLGADDADLGIRLNKAGLKIKCNAEAVVFHTKETWSSFFAVAGRAFRWGRMDLHLYFFRHSDRLAYSLPKFSHIFLLLICLAIIESLFFFKPIPLLLPILWVFITLFAQAVISIIVSAKSPLNILYELLADVLGLIFEFGTIFEGIIQKEPKIFYKTVRRGPMLPNFEQTEWVIQSWSMWFGILLTILINKAL
ncbi:MAG TPA: glycosyltransferase [Pyrinomonadaceae bacterium]|nr:glycosyltransferase [Pyrinomonadaceae bacterium]